MNLVQRRRNHRVTSKPCTSVISSIAGCWRRRRARDARKSLGYGLTRSCCGKTATWASQACQRGFFVSFSTVADSAIEKLIQQLQQFHFPENFERAAQEPFALQKVPDVFFSSV
jgi:hypothetical protein